MSHKRSTIASVRFCPWCGMERLERDKYRMFRNDKWEFVCSLCGAAFRILESTRKQDANRMMAHERRQRVPTPTDPKQIIRLAQDQYNSLCKRKFREFKAALVTDVVGGQMREWLNSEEHCEAKARLEMAKVSRVND